MKFRIGAACLFLSAMFVLAGWGVYQNANVSYQLKFSQNFVELDMVVIRNSAILEKEKAKGTTAEGIWHVGAGGNITGLTGFYDNLTGIGVGWRMTSSGKLVLRQQVVDHAGNAAEVGVEYVLDLKPLSKRTEIGEIGLLFKNDLGFRYFYVLTIDHTPPELPADPNKIDF